MKPDETPVVFARANREWFGDGAAVLCLGQVMGAVSLDRGEAIIGVRHRGPSGPTSLAHWELANCFAADQYVPLDRAASAERQAEWHRARSAALEEACRKLLSACAPVSPEQEQAFAELTLAVDPPADEADND